MPRIFPTFGPSHLVLAVALLLFGLFAYAAAQTATQTYRLRQAERQLQLDIGELSRQRGQLTGLLEYVESDEYIEAFAREQFGFVRPGETAVFIDAPPAPEREGVAGERWWEALFIDD